MTDTFKPNWLNSYVFFILVSPILIALALLPTIIAVKKNHPHKLPIILVNILGGLFFGIGWLVALVWCFINPSTPVTTGSAPSANEIEKLHNLLEKGALTQKEFDVRKQRLLR